MTIYDTIKHLSYDLCVYKPISSMCVPQSPDVIR